MNLVTRNEYKAIQGITTTAYDDQIDALLAAVSQVALNYTERDFGVEPVLATKTYSYDGSGVLEINDATTVTAVSWVDGPTLQTTDYVVHPQNGVLTWIELPPYPRHGSPEMGFKRNLDRFPWYLQEREAQIEVTGTFGWRLEDNGTRVPADVKLAVATSIETFIQTDGEVSSESIASYSVQYSQLTPRQAFSTEGLSMLDFYLRLRIV